MIGNSYLQKLFEYPDADTGLNQLLELLNSNDDQFIGCLRKPVDIDSRSD